MPLKVVKEDIFSLDVDALVNPTDQMMSGSGSIDGKVHYMCGDALTKELYGKQLEFGNVVVTNAYNMKCKYIFHTCGELYTDDETEFDKKKKENTIINCYYNALKKADSMNLYSISFPLIGTGSLRNPIDKSILSAVQTIIKYLSKTKSNLLVYFVLYTEEAYQEALKIFPVDVITVNTNLKIHMQPSYTWNAKEAKEFYAKHHIKTTTKIDLGNPTDGDMLSSSKKSDLSQLLVQSFGDDVKAYLKEKNKKAYELASDIGISEYTLNRYLNGRKQIPKKDAIKIALILELDINKAINILAKAGYAFSDSYIEDIVIKNCIINKIYDFDKINEELNKYTDIYIY